MITYKRHIGIKQLLGGKGEFRIENLLPKGKMLFSSAIRLGLLDVIDSLCFSKNECVMLPPICPQGLYIPFNRKKIPIRFYHLKDNFAVDTKWLEDSLEDINCKVFIFIHYFGIYNPQVVEIKELCTKHKMILIEDAVQGLFSTDHEGVPLGSIGDISLFSFPKFLPVSDGVAFVINNPQLNIVFSYKKNLLVYLSRFFHSNSLLWNNLITDDTNGIPYKIIKAFSLFNYALYYFLLCLAKQNQDISKMSRRILSVIDYDDYLARRHRILQCYNSGLYQYEYRQKVQNFSGYLLEVKENDTKDVIKELNRLGLETLSYIKGWNYIPDTEEFEYERFLLRHHLLLPINADVPLSAYEQKMQKIKSILNR
ncbi:MAG: DegT/DnrJ/EryC1/StrS family aminotransferase [Candidatus Limimorpha sp.]